MSDAITRAPEFVVDVQHGPARIAEDRIDALVYQSFDQDLGAARLWYRRLAMQSRLRELVFAVVRSLVS